MTQPYVLEKWCNNKLLISDFDDFCPNGLQIEGTRTINRLVTGVTANKGLIDAAIEWNADAILVHHGLFWKKEPLPLTSIKGNRVRLLMCRGLSLFAYHLPLDAHPEIGNNRCFGNLLHLNDIFPVDGFNGMLWYGKFQKPISAQKLKNHLEIILHRVPLHIAGKHDLIHTISWCTGGAQKYIEKAAILRMDAFISGEISENTVHIAREMGIDYFAAGHHATERYGVQSLGEEIAKEFGIRTNFIDINNPV